MRENKLGSLTAVQLERSQNAVFAKTGAQTAAGTQSFGARSVANSVISAAWVLVFLKNCVLTAF